MNVIRKTTSIEIQFFWNKEETLVRYSARVTMTDAPNAAMMASVRGVGFFTA